MLKEQDYVRKCANNLDLSKKHTIFATSKGNLWLSGQNPARGKPLSTLPNFTNANHAIGYAAECGEQDFIDTTPFFIAKGAF